MKYHRPTDLDACLKLMQEHPADEWRILAGGTDLLVQIEMAGNFPPNLIDIKHLPELSTVSVFEDELRIGALTTLEEIRQHELIKAEFHALHQAACQFAGLQVRNRATLGGNICNASPAGDTLPALHAFESTLLLAGPAGQREVSIGEFILAPGKTDLHPDELLLCINLPRQNRESDFFKLGLRDSMAIAVVNLATAYSLNGSGFKYLQMAAGAVAPTIVTLDHYTAAVLERSSVSEVPTGLIEQDIQPIDDIRASAGYRSKVLQRIAAAQLSEILDGDHN